MITPLQLFSLQQVSCELELLPTRYKEIKRNPFIKLPEGSEEPLIRKVEAKRLFLRGKVRYFEEWQSLLFICHPLYVIIHSHHDLLMGAHQSSNSALHV